MEKMKKTKARPVFKLYRHTNQSKSPGGKQSRGPLFLRTRTRTALDSYLRGTSCGSSTTMKRSGQDRSQINVTMGPKLN